MFFRQYKVFLRVKFLKTPVTENSDFLCSIKHEKDCFLNLQMCILMGMKLFFYVLGNFWNKCDFLEIIN